MNNIQFDCTECGHKLKVDIMAAGKKVPCPICKNKIRIPRESDSQYLAAPKLAKLAEPKEESAATQANSKNDSAGDLQMTVDKLNDDLRDAKQNYEAVKFKLESAEGHEEELKSQKKEIASLVKENEKATDLKQEIQTLKTRNNELNKQVAKASEDSAKTDDALRQHEEAEAHIADLEKKLDVAETSQARVESKLKDAEATHSDLEKQLKATQSNQAGVEQKVKDAEVASQSEVLKVQAENAKLADEVTALRQKVTEAEKKRDALATDSKELADLRKKVKEAEGLGAKINELEAQVDLLKTNEDEVKRLEALVSAGEKKSTDVQAGLKTEKETLANQISTLEKSLQQVTDAKEHELVALRKRLTKDFESEQNSIQSVLKEKSDALDHAEAELASFQQAVVDAEARAVTAQGEAEDAETLKTALIEKEKALVLQQASITKLKEELELTAKELSSSTEKHQDELARVVAEHKTELNEGIQRVKSPLEVIIEQQQQELDSVQQELSAVTDSVASSNDAFQATTREKDALAQAHKSQAAELATLKEAIQGVEAEAQKVGGLQAELEKLTHDLEAFEALPEALEDLNTKYGVLKERNASLEGQLEDAAVTFHKLGNEKGKVEQALTAVENKFSESMASAESRIADVNGENQTLAENLELQEAEVARLTQVSNDFEELKGGYQKVEQKVAELQAELGDQQALVAEVSTSRDSAQLSLNDLQGSFAALELVKETLESERTGLRVQLNERTIALEAAGVDSQKLNAELSTLSTELKAVQEALNAAHAQTEGLNAQVSNLEVIAQEKTRLDARLAELGEAHIQLLEDNEQSLKLIKELQQVVSAKQELDKRFLKLQEDYNTLAELRLTLEGQIDDLQEIATAKAELDAQHESLQIEHEKALKKLAHETKSGAALKNSLEALTVDKNEADKVVDELTNIRKSLEIGTAALTAKRDEQADTIEEQSKEIVAYKGLQLEHHKLKDVYDEAKDQVQGLTAEREKLLVVQAEGEKFKKDLDATRYGLEGSQREVAEVHGHMADVQMALNEQSAALKEKEALAERLEKQLDEIRSSASDAGEKAVAASNSRIEELESELGGMQASITGLKDELGSKKNELAKANSQLKSAETAKEKITEQGQQNSDQLKSLKTELSKFKDNEASLKAEIAARKNDIADMKEKMLSLETTSGVVGQASKENDRLNKQVQALDSDLTSTRNQVAELKEQLVDKDKNIKGLKEKAVNLSQEAEVDAVVTAALEETKAKLEVAQKRETELEESIKVRDEQMEELEKELADNQSNTVHKAAPVGSSASSGDVDIRVMELEQSLLDAKTKTEGMDAELTQVKKRESQRKAIHAEELNRAQTQYEKLQRKLEKLRKNKGDIGDADEFDAPLFQKAPDQPTAEIEKQMGELASPKKEEPEANTPEVKPDSGKKKGLGLFRRG